MQTPTDQCDVSYSSGAVWLPPISAVTEQLTEVSPIIKPVTCTATRLGNGDTERGPYVDTCKDLSCSASAFVSVGVLISLWLFLFSYLQHNRKNFS
jgi:hypothetical protein